MAATINGKKVLHQGTQLIRTGQVVHIDGGPSVEISVDDSAPFGVTLTGTSSGYGISINGFADQFDGGIDGHGWFAGKPITLVVYVQRVMTDGVGIRTYRVDFTFIEA